MLEINTPSRLILYWKRLSLLFCFGWMYNQSRGKMQQTFQCPKCGSYDSIGQRFCTACGEKFEYRCAYCGSSIDPGLRFCPYCGTSISGVGLQQPGRIQKQTGWGSLKIGRQSLSSTSLLLILLFSLLLCIGGFAYWQFHSSPQSPGDTTPPTISNVSVVFKTKSGAIITWKTDEPASSQVEYGRTPSYGSLYPAQPLNDPVSGMSEGVTSHTVNLRGLQSGMTYHFKVKSKDAAGNEAKSTGDRTFKTLESSLY